MGSSAIGSTNAEINALPLQSPTSKQIQFLLGHASVQTTERYLGCKQNLGHPVNDRFTLETHTASPAPESMIEVASTGRPGFLREDAQPEMVIDRKGNCSPFLRSSPAAGVGCSVPLKKINGSEDQASVRTVGSGALPHASEGDPEDVKLKPASEIEPYGLSKSG